MQVFASLQMMEAFKLCYRKWNFTTVEIVRKIKCLKFSQLSKFRWKFPRYSIILQQPGEKN